MLYMPYRRTRQAFFIYLAILAAIVIIGVTIRFWPGVVHSPDSLDAGRFAMFRIDGWLVAEGCALFSVLFATIVGLNLAAENDGHLEIAWTLPISREMFALRVFALDVGAMLLAVALALVAAIGLADLYLGHQAVVFAGTSTSGTYSTEVKVGEKVPEHLAGVTKPGVIVDREVQRVGNRIRVTEVRAQVIDVGREALGAISFATFPICIYAWITALSASLKRNRGIVAGLFWPVTLGLGGAQFIPFEPVRVIVAAIDKINPIAIYSHQSGQALETPWVGYVSIVVLLALAIVQWRRIEA